MECVLCLLVSSKNVVEFVVYMNEEQQQALNSDIEDNDERTTEERRNEKEEGCLRTYLNRRTIIQFGLWTTEQKKRKYVKINDKYRNIPAFDI